MFSIDCFMMEMVETFTPVYSIHSCLQTLDNGVNVVQLETAVGAAIKSFEGAIGEFYTNQIAQNINVDATYPFTFFLSL